MAKDDGYTKTGNGGLQRFADGIAIIPFIGPIIAPFIGLVGTVIESAGHLFKGDIGSAATELTTGMVTNAVHSVTAVGIGLGTVLSGPFAPLTHTLFWGSKALIGGITGNSVATHARAMSEGVIGSVTGALGVKPKILQSNVAGIVGINGGFQSQRPGQFATMVSNQRGRNPGQDWRAHVEASRAEAQMGVQR